MNGLLSLLDLFPSGLARAVTPRPPATGGTFADWLQTAAGAARGSGGAPGAGGTPSAFIELLSGAAGTAAVTAPREGQAPGPGRFHSNGSAGSETTGERPPVEAPPFLEADGEAPRPAPVLDPPPARALPEAAVVGTGDAAAQVGPPPSDPGGSSPSPGNGPIGDDAGVVRPPFPGAGQPPLEQPTGPAPRQSRAGALARAYGLPDHRPGTLPPVSPGKQPGPANAEGAGDGEALPRLAARNATIAALRAEPGPTAPAVPPGAAREAAVPGPERTGEAGSPSLEGQRTRTAAGLRAVRALPATSFASSAVHAGAEEPGGRPALRGAPAGGDRPAGSVPEAVTGPASRAIRAAVEPRLDGLEATARDLPPGDLPPPPRTAPVRPGEPDLRIPATPPADDAETIPDPRAPIPRPGRPVETLLRELRLDERAARAGLEHAPGSAAPRPSARPSPRAGDRGPVHAAPPARLPEWPAGVRFEPAQPRLPVPAPTDPGERTGGRSDYLDPVPSEAFDESPERTEPQRVAPAEARPDGRHRGDGAPPPRRDSGRAARADAAGQATRLRGDGARPVQGRDAAPLVHHSRLAEAIVARARNLPQNGTLELRFALEPADLGPVRIRLESRGDQLRVHIIAASDVAVEQLGPGIARLTAQLQEAGFREPQIQLGLDGSNQGDREERRDLAGLARRRAVSSPSAAESVERTTAGERLRGPRDSGLDLIA